MNGRRWGGHMSAVTPQKAVKITKGAVAASAASDAALPTSRRAVSCRSVVGNVDGTTVGAGVLGEALGNSDGEVLGDVDGEVVGSEVLGEVVGLVVGSEVASEIDGDLVVSEVGEVLS